MVVGTVASLLAQSGIETEYRNDLLGGAAGELAPGDTWVELWVSDDSQASKAEQLIKETMEQPEQDEWRCIHCGELNPATFEVCWQCGKPSR